MNASSRNWGVPFLSFAGGIIVAFTCSHIFQRKHAPSWTGSEHQQSPTTPLTKALTHEELELPHFIQHEKELADQLINEKIVGPIAKNLVGRLGCASESQQSIVVAVAGGTGSGKTTLTRAIHEGLEEVHPGCVTYISHDNYYKDLSHQSLEERAKTNFDHPDSLDTDLLVEHIKALKAGKTVQIPHYDFSTHLRKQEKETKYPRKVILIEGILIFDHKELNKIADIKIFVDTDADVRLVRRIERDRKERGRSIESIIQQYLETVRPMHEQFVEPSKRNADIIVPFGLNTVVLDMVLSRLKHEIEKSDSESC